MTRFLIDTHIIFWWFAGPGNKIRKRHLSLIADPLNEVCVSVLSLFELYIKGSLGKIRLPSEFQSVFNEASFTLLPLQSEHFETFLSLELHHRDPFDRMIIAQAIVEGLPIISYDRMFSDYPVKLL